MPDDLSRGGESPSLGHNSGIAHLIAPEVIADQLAMQFASRLTRRDDLLNAVDAFSLAYPNGPLTDDDAGLAGDQIKQIKDEIKEIDALRVGEKKPFAAKPFGKFDRSEKKSFEPKGDRKFVRGPGKPAPRGEREGGFAPREGGYSKRPAAGGFAPRREGSFGAKREGGFAPRREGSGFPRTGAPKRAGGFGGKREGAPAGRGKAGFSKGPRTGAAPRKRRD